MKDNELIINARGDTREVSPLYPKFEVPEKQKIVFPDKKEHSVTWRNTFDAITEVSKLLEESEIVQEEGTYRVPLSHPEIPYAVGLNLSDSHIGASSSDHEMVKGLLETVLTTPNTFLIDTGDTFNNGIWGSLGYEDIIPPYMQAFTVDDMIRELGEKYGACVVGNHPEWMFDNAGIRPEMMFAKQMKGPVFAGMGLLHLEVGSQKYDWAMAHNYWGKSKINIHNVCVRLRQNEYPDADIFSVGHQHIWGHMKEMVAGRDVLYIRPGTSKLKDRYARIHGIAKRGQKCGVAVIFSTEEKDFEATTIEKAVRFMNSLKHGRESGHNSK